MQMFIFARIDQVSHNYHPEGGLMIVAEDKEHVLELIADEEYIEITEDEWENVITYQLVDDVEPGLLVFPDAGCC